MWTPGPFETVFVLPECHQVGRPDAGWYSRGIRHQCQQSCHEGPFGQIDGWMLGSMAACKNQEFCRVVLTVGVLHLLSFHAVQPKPLISAPARPDGRRARAGRGRSIAGTFAR